MMNAMIEIQPAGTEEVYYSPIYVIYFVVKSKIVQIGKHHPIGCI